MDHSRSQSATHLPVTGSISTWVAYAIAIPSTIALVISAYLAYATFTMSDVAGCGGGSIFDCGHVLHSKWSKAAGVPVSVFAFATHALLISGLFVMISQRFGSSVRKLATCVVLVAAVAASLAALYFISLQVFVLKHLCSYCMVAHTCGLIVGAMTIWKLPIAATTKKRLTGFAAAGIAALASIQITSAEPPKFKIDTFVAPAETGQSDLENANTEESSDDSSDLFSAPGSSDSSEETDIFAAPVSDAKEPGNSVRSSSQELAMLDMISVHNLFLSNNALLVAPAAQQATEGSATSKGSASKPKQPAQAKPKQPAQAKPKLAAKKSKRLVPMNGGSIKLKAVDWPLIGDPDAKHAFIELFDYTCEHCRATNKAIEAAKQKLGKDLAVLVLPVPMNRTCNPLIKTNMPDHAESCDLSRLAIAVWRVDSKKFEEFHRWMFQGEKAPTYSQALAKASEWVDTIALNKELADSVCSQYIGRNVELYKRTGGGTIPKMVFQQTTIVGEFTSGESLANLIKEYTAAK